MRKVENECQAWRRKKARRQAAASQTRVIARRADTLVEVEASGVVVAPSLSNGGRKQKKKPASPAPPAPKGEWYVAERVRLEERQLIWLIFRSLSHVKSWAHMPDVLQDC
jgi:hypothetical protein